MGLGLDTQGAAHCHQLKSLDWKARKAKFKEKVPRELVDDVAARIDAILWE
jgi:mRNA interferase ChpB